MRLRRSKREEIDRADEITWALLAFSAVRGIVWLTLIGCVAGGLFGVPWLHWASRLSAAVVFVTLISLYANAEGEFSQVAGMWAAIRAGRAHAQGVHNEEVGVDSHEEVLRRIEALGETIYDHLLRSER